MTPGRLELPPQPGRPASVEWVAVIRELADIKRKLNEILQRLPKGANP